MNPRSNRSLLRVLAGFLAALGTPDTPAAADPLRYEAQGGAIVIRNGTHFNNRPLYCNHMPVFTLAGDRPFLLFAGGHYINGSLMLALVRGDQGLWLQEASSVVARYQGGGMEWELTDARFGETLVRLQALPLAESPGFAARVAVENAKPGDRIVWAYGGARHLPDNQRNASWALDALGHPEILKQGFAPEHCQGNQVRLDGEWFALQPPAYEPEEKLPMQTVVGRCSSATGLGVGDAAEWRDFARFVASKAQERPIVFGSIDLDVEPEAYWAVQSFAGEKAGDTGALTSPAAAFAAGRRRLEEVSRQVVVNTPDARLNALVSSSCITMDAVWYPPMFAHGAMQWNSSLLGWRTLFGAVCYGWHDRVKRQAGACISRQIRESTNITAKADPETGLSTQAAESRMFGKGYVDAYHPHHYDMQSQFFDQVLHGWRYTADPELENLLRPALELHCEWMKDCFDPDGDGVYESYINTWPTDSQWYSGAGTAEETAYAFRAHQAARDLARRAGDAAAVVRHNTQLQKIQQGFLRQLWIPQKGYVGAYREQLGHRRLNENPWLYSIFLPIDAGLLSPLQAAEALHFTEWGLQNDRMPAGGRRVWTSNWVPSLWSVREMWPGDNHHLALAYFQTGLPADGWDIFQGTFLESAFAGPVPGNLGHEVGGLDFNDCSSMFCRALVEGLFGYQPNYPDGAVRVSPQFPPEWNHASIRTPDFALDFEQQTGSTRLTIELTRAAAISVQLPLPSGPVRSVKLDGKPVKWSAMPGFGRSVLRVDLPETRRAELVIAGDAPEPPVSARQLKVTAGQRVEWAAAKGEFQRFEDPQGVLGQAAIRKGKLVGVVTTNAGHHLVRALARAGGQEYWQLLKVQVSDPGAEAARAAKRSSEIPANATWACVDLAKAFNGDVRAIYEQQYLSPRPQTVSARIGSDGFAPWPFYPWGYKRPNINLDEVPELLDEEGRLKTPQGVPFVRPGNGTNIAFTSQWDNWPRQITVPVQKQGDAVWLLICGSSNPMQCGIANAELQMRYADGVVERLELVHPDNYWTLCPINVHPSGPGQPSRGDYNYGRDGFCLPNPPPLTVQLGQNCRANLLSWRLRPDKSLESVTLETLSPEVVVGLMGVTLMNPRTTAQ